VRLTTPKGSDHPRARFTPEEVTEIRKSYADDPRSLRKIAKEQGCHHQTISEILNNLSYR
jgi:DNA invertase Pin-like site-specific DNA recombinase